MKITINTVESFLSRNGHDRQWLANELGCSRGTLNNWFSKKEFPEWGAKAVARIIDQHERSPSDLKFSLSEWRAITHASNLSGASGIDDFIVNSLIEKAEEIIARETEEAERGEIYEFPRPEEPRVAGPAGDKDKDDDD